jgi:hypothetical protein
MIIKLFQKVTPNFITPYTLTTNSLERKNIFSSIWNKNEDKMREKENSQSICAFWSAIYHLYVNTNCPIKFIIQLTYEWPTAGCWSYLLKSTSMTALAFCNNFVRC